MRHKLFALWQLPRSYAKLPPLTTNGDTLALEKFLRPMARSLSLELSLALVSLTADDETQARYDTLAGKHTEGQLTWEEREELEAFVRVNTLLGILKVEARELLSKNVD